MIDGSLRDQVIEVGIGSGLDRVGMCSADPFPDARTALIERREDGLSGGLGFTFARPNQAADIRTTFPWAATLVVGACAYLPKAGDPGPTEPGTGRVARFATADHYLPLRGALVEVARLLESSGHRAEVMVDDSRLVDRAAAVRAGIGWWGKNTMVLTPALGPWFLIGSVVTDAEFEADAPMTRDCGTCEACLPACPTGALVAPGVLDARRCLAAVLQQKGSIPHHLRRAVGDRIYGCDDCLDVCPPGSRLLGRTTVPAGRHDAAELLALDDAGLLDRFEHFFVPGRKARFLRRNLLVVLGNTGDEQHVSLISRWLDDPDSLLRVHAAWALGRIGTSSAHAMLRRRLAAESDRHVVDEIEQALDQVSVDPIGP